jgi:hypothetical protein
MRTALHGQATNSRFGVVETTRILTSRIVVSLHSCYNLCTSSIRWLAIFLRREASLHYNYMTGGPRASRFLFVPPTLLRLLFKMLILRITYISSVIVWRAIA